MARNVDDLIAALPASRRRKIEKRARALQADEMTLQELRRAREMTQVKMAKQLGVAQKQISEIEKRTDMHISTLRRQIRALGGELTLTAKFPDSPAVELTGLSDPGNEPAELAVTSRQSPGRRRKKSDRPSAERKSTAGNELVTPKSYSGREILT
jgi:transcriptional regulator with XRE-family HTH domain